MKVGKGNIECLCLTCEKRQQGGFTPREGPSNAPTPGGPASPTASASAARLAKRKASASSLRNPVALDGDAEDGMSSVAPTPAADPLDDADSPASSHGNSATSLFAAKSTKDTDTTVYTPPDDCPIDPQTPAAYSEVAEGDLIEEDNDDDDEENGSGSESEESVAPRTRYERQARNKAKPREWWKKQKAKSPEVFVSLHMEDDDYPPDFPRCATCAKALVDRIWFNARYFEHCARWVLLSIAAVMES